MRDWLFDLMITIRIYLTTRSDKRTEFIQTVKDLCQKIAKESGCTSCRFYQSPENADELVVIEEWKNEPMARKHVKSENFALLVGACSVLTQKVSIGLCNDPPTGKLKHIFEKRMAI